MNTFEIGRFQLKTQYRDVSSDRGPAIHLYGPTPNGTMEILRFDCFETEPHYHLAFAYKDQPFIRIESPAPFAWAREKLQKDAVALLAASDALPMDASERAILDSILDDLLPPEAPG